MQGFIIRLVSSQKNLNRYPYPDSPIFVVNPLLQANILPLHAERKSSVIGCQLYDGTQFLSEAECRPWSIIKSAKSEKTRWFSSDEFWSYVAMVVGVSELLCSHFYTETMKLY